MLLAPPEGTIEIATKGVDILISILGAVATFLITYGRFREKIRQLERRVGEIDTDKTVRLEVTLHEVKASLRRVHDRLDAVNETITRLNSEIARVDERTEVSGVVRDVVRRRYPESEPRKPAPAAPSTPLPPTRPKRKAEDATPA